MDSTRACVRDHFGGLANTSYALFLILALLMLPIYGVRAQETSKLDEVLQRGKLIVGVGTEAPPFGFIDESGELVGFDIDIARLVAKSLFGDPNKIEFFRQNFAARWPNVQNGTIDFGIQVTTVYADRLLRVAFTRTYVDTQSVIVVRKDSAFKTPADLNRSDVTVAHATAAVQEDRGKRFYPQAQFLTLDSVAAQFNAVKIGRANAAQLDTPVANWYLKNNPDMRILERPLSDPSGDAIFLRMGDFKWWLYLDSLVGEMTGGSLYSEYRDIYMKWFGKEPINTRTGSLK